jgi:hypothetical protein
MPVYIPPVIIKLINVIRTDAEKVTNIVLFDMARFGKFFVQFGQFPVCGSQIIPGAGQSFYL